MTDKSERGQAMDERYEILLRNAYRLFNPTDSLNDSMRVGWHVEEHGVEFHGASDGDEVEFETPELAAAIGYALDEMAILRIRIADLENVTMSERGIEAMGYMKLPVGEEGEPIRPGETVYGPNTGDDGKNVLAATPLAVLLGGTDQWSLCLDPGSLTHEPQKRFPLDADGVECRVGDRVWWSENPTVPLVIEAVEPDEYAQLTVCDDDGLRNTIEAAECTHTEPDSWERLEDDATMEPFAYLERHGLLGIDIPTAENFACDLVRRAKALAGIGGGE